MIHAQVTWLALGATNVRVSGVGIDAPAAAATTHVNAVFSVPRVFGFTSVPRADAATARLQVWVKTSGAVTVFAQSPLG